ncbi:hypothetical protein CK5_27900 [Blautia obeum A2-162]|uniref:Uncharacterized protein n=1 Tax=Blautia obeum A2-162 TaxID=657314 RepID=D4LTE7_9FIRM|nr:hypothetical protein CK5_27900 [Blautia obeum A2-162]
MRSKGFFFSRKCVILTTGNVPFYQKEQANHKKRKKL